jgi:hypothetical protein
LNIKLGQALSRKHVTASCFDNKLIPLVQIGLRAGKLVPLAPLHVGLQSSVALECWSKSPRQPVNEDEINVPAAAAFKDQNSCGWWNAGRCASFGCLLAEIM